MLHGPRCWILVAGLAVSGCLADGGAPDRGGGIGEEGFDAETGSIRGSVVTLELEPVFDAAVRVPGSRAETRSDETGRFLIPFVPPGTQEVEASAPGFLPVTKSVVVIAGATTDEVVFTLVEAGRVVPYHTTNVHRLLVSGVAATVPRDCVYVTAQIKTCEATAPSCEPYEPNECGVHYGHCDDGGPYETWGCDFGAGWKTIIAELASTPTSAATGKGWSFTVLGPNVSRRDGDSGPADNGEKRAWRTVSEAPVYTWIDEAVLVQRQVEEDDWCGGIDIVPGRCDWAWRLFPGPCELGCEFPAGNVGIMQDQPATVYFSYFMFEPAPPEWSAVPDS